MKMKNNTLAIPAAPAAIPPKPKMAAMMAMIKKVIVQRNIAFYFLVMNKLVTMLKIQKACQRFKREKRSFPDKAFLGFGGIAAGAAGIAKVLFFIFIVLFLLSLMTEGTVR